VSVWIDVFRGKEFCAGSVVVLASASHMQLHGVGGYILDLADCFKKIGRIFGGRVFCVPGVPVLIGGSDDPFLVKTIFQVEGWLRGSGDAFPSKTWAKVLKTLTENRGDFGS